MSIARKPNSNRPAAHDAVAEKFIAGAGALPPTAAPSNPPEAAKRKPAMVRFDADLLSRVDRAAKRRGISRSAWIQYTLSQALDQEAAS